MQVGDESVRVELLPERMRQELVDRTEKSVFVRGDAEITLQQFMTVMDVLKEGGVVSVGLVADFPDGR